VKRLLLLCFCLAIGVPSAVRAQDVDDAVLRLAEPDFTLIGLPTNLRLPQFGSAFRVTHRFTRPLNDDFDDVAGDLFGIDSSAQIGLEYRFGIVRNGQIGIHRTSNRTIEFFGQYGVMRQGANRPLDVSAFLAIDGTNNFRDSHSPALGAIVSRQFGNTLAVYVEPMWINNSNALPRQLVDDNNTVIVGIGARVRVRPTVYVVGEAAPRSGYKPGTTHVSFGIEKRAGGHMFQLNFSDGFGTTPAQIARGGPVDKDWFLGFNISRKFF
jgi:hypothetical protein